MWEKIDRSREVISTQGPTGFLCEGVYYALRNAPIGNTPLIYLSKRQIQKRVSREDGLEDVLDTVLEIEPGIRPFQISALQLRQEIRSLCQLLDGKDVRTILEIGTANGGTLYTWCRYLDTVSDVISIDLPQGEFGGGYPEDKTKVYRSFAGSKNLHFVRGNSHDEHIYEHVRADILGSKIDEDGIDLLFIDGDHTYEGVRQDFEMYRKLVNEGGIVAFHDIVETKNNPLEVEELRKEHPKADSRYFPWSSSHPSMEVDVFWSELATEYETLAFQAHPDQTAYGIGVVQL